MGKTFDYRHFVHTPAELSTEYVQFAERLKASPGITFGIGDVDKHVSPMHPGDVVAFMGRPGHAKTSVLAYFARTEGQRIYNRGKAKQEAVVYVTYEQSAEELEAYFQTNDQYSNSDLMRGKVDLDLIRDRSIKRPHLPVWVIGHGLSRIDPRAPRMTPDVVYKAIETMEEDYGIKPALVLVDYMQLIPVLNASDRVQQVTEVPIRVKELAMRVGCPAVLAVQAGRGVDERKVKLPMLADAQWASSIEQTCDKVFALWRPWQTEEQGKAIELEDGNIYQVTETLLIMRMLKQRFEDGRWTWALHFNPKTLELKAVDPVKAPPPLAY